MDIVVEFGTDGDYSDYSERHGNGTVEWEGKDGLVDWRIMYG